MKLLLSLLMLPLMAPAQNLLLNSSFEEENICTEYKVNCAPEAWIYTVPSFIYYFKNAKQSHSGEHCIVLIAGHEKKPLYRTFVRSRLLCGLQAGKSYRLQCWVRSAYPVLDSVGIYFSSYDFLFQKQVYQKIKPALYFTDAAEKASLRDTGWQRVSASYTANGTEAFITIGNFKKNGLTIPTNRLLEKNIFFYIDDISLLPEDANEQLCAGWKEAAQDIYDQDERHEYLARKIREYKNKPDETVTLPKTTTPHVDTLIMPDMLFASGKTTLVQTAVLDSLARTLDAGKIDSIVIEGHADSTGSKALNEALAAARAAEAGAYIKKFLAAAIITRSWGALRPIADNRIPEGRRRNRRVEIYIYKRR